MYNCTFSAFFCTRETNGCFHFDMYFWLVTMVSQHMMASVCFLMHSCSRRWQSSSEKTDGNRGWKKPSIINTQFINQQMLLKNKHRVELHYAVCLIPPLFLTEQLERRTHIHSSSSVWAIFYTLNSLIHFTFI